MVILTYHKVNDASNFARQISYLLDSGYRVLSIQDFIRKFEERALKDTDVLITFDDGDPSVLENGLPVLKRYGCPAVLFVVTGLIGTSSPFWWDEIMYYGNDPNEVRRAKDVPNHERLRMIERLRLRSDKRPLKVQQMSLADLKSLEKNGIAIANHSHTHPMLDKLQTDEIFDELRNSTDFLKTNGFSCFDVFAYPNGNHCPAAEEAFKLEGIRYAFLFDHLLNDQYAAPYRISRLSVNDYTPLPKFRFILSGWHSRLVPVTKKLVSLFR